MENSLKERLFFANARPFPLGWLRHSSGSARRRARMVAMLLTFLLEMTRRTCAMSVTQRRKIVSLRVPGIRRAGTESPTELDLIDAVVGSTP